MEMLENRHLLGQWTQAIRRQGLTLGFVPTMGALHEGHLSLLRAAQQRSDRVIVSIFVNPTQFGPHEDFNHYPRTLVKDQALLQEAGCSGLFCPSVEEMYGTGCQTRVQVEPLGHDLCGRFRPDHFQGVATVVALLFNLIRPDWAFFGWKDYQQVILLQRMVHDLAMPVEVVGLPIQREADGLALSSRNRFLTPEERQQAVGLYQALLAVRDLWLQGNCDWSRVWGEDPLVVCARQVLKKFALQTVDYVEVREATTLDPLPLHTRRVGQTHLVLLLAARLGATRLIDNMILSSDAVARPVASLSSL